MTEKIGRNDPCPCGSGKKYKQCCLANKPRKEYSLSGMRKFSAKIISAGGVHKKEAESTEEQANVNQAIMDYNTLMERSFGNAIHSEEMPPLPKPSEFEVKE